MKNKEFHEKMARCFAKSASAHRTLGQDDLAEAADAAADCHLGMAKAAGGDVDKAAFGMLAARDADQLQPTAAYAIIPDNPMAKTRLVPRPGQDLMVPTDPGEDATQVLDKAMGRV